LNSLISINKLLRWLTEQRFFYVRRNVQVRGAVYPLMKIDCIDTTLKPAWLLRW